ncbi:hypothetical protein BDV28DRAFT_77742 [Aspergillus coremiiformis]|uniref:Uncharacterized protein n=1 Tax=Aspergillus coremiiformis TaxID=138285 RepID=A0A5N6YTG6_9EURO|nr:hypothetical protein BDV28DRAFT_77742 [Aspergillus coremiiformis]
MNPTSTTHDQFSLLQPRFSLSMTIRTKKIPAKKKPLSKKKVKRNRLLLATTCHVREVEIRHERGDPNHVVGVAFMLSILFVDSYPGPVLIFSLSLSFSSGCQMFCEKSETLEINLSDEVSLISFFGSHRGFIVFFGWAGSISRGSFSWIDRMIWRDSYGSTPARLDRYPCFLRSRN